MTEWGLKLWSINTDHYLQAAKQLYQKDEIDYVELYSVPGDLENLHVWKESKLPFVIHCAHSMHKFNLSSPKQYLYNKELFSEAFTYYKELNASAIIIHPGVLGSYKETAQQILRLLEEFSLSPQNLLLENKPYITLTDDRTAASSPIEIAEILSTTGVGFVLDVTHAIKFAISTNENVWKVLKQFQELSPAMLHVSDAHLNTPHDEHLHIGLGEFDFRKIFSCCSAQKISIETVKNSRYNLNDFSQDVKVLKEEHNDAIYRRSF